MRKLVHGFYLVKRISNWKNYMIYFFFFVFFSDDHIEQVHVKSKIYECKECKETFDTHGKYQVHKDNAHKSKDHICEECGYATFSVFRLTRHLESHLEAKFHCDQCDLSCKTEKQLEYHKLVHSGVKIPCTFPGCDATFARQDDVRKHIKNSHMMKDLKHKCSQCGKRFHQPAKLKVHVERVHEGKRKIYSCQHCDSTYSHPSGLKEHIESIHQGVLYMCDYPGCRKTMNRKGNLDAHKKSAHGIERPRTPKSVNISS